MKNVLTDEYFLDNGHPIKCPFCECEIIKSAVKDYIDVGVGRGIPCEEEFYCGNEECEETIGYWAYGSYEPCFLESVAVPPKMFKI